MKIFVSVSIEAVLVVAGVVQHRRPDGDSREGASGHGGATVALQKPLPRDQERRFWRAALLEEAFAGRQRHHHHQALRLPWPSPPEGAFHPAHASGSGGAVRLRRPPKCLHHPAGQ